jgi:hypothetical protein
MPPGGNFNREYFLILTVNNFNRRWTQMNADEEEGGLKFRSCFLATFQWMVHPVLSGLVLICVHPRPSAVKNKTSL